MFPSKVKNGSLTKIGLTWRWHELGISGGGIVLVVHPSIVTTHIPTFGVDFALPIFSPGVTVILLVTVLGHYLGEIKFRGTFCQHEVRVKIGGILGLAKVGSCSGEFFRGGNMQQRPSKCRMQKKICITCRTQMMQKIFCKLHANSFRSSLRHSCSAQLQNDMVGLRSPLHALMFHVSCTFHVHHNC